jgi:hypothetical protein
MTGYPLDKSEKAAVEKTIESSRRASLRAISGKYSTGSGEVKPSDRKRLRRRAK